MRRFVLLLPFVAFYNNSPSGDEDAGVEAGPPAPYTQTLLDDARIGSDSSKPNFQKATADVTLTGAPFANVNLVVDLSSTCFPFSNWLTDKPPPGQYWPADCDALDRNFEMALIDPANPSAPGIELVRAITPFGGPERIEQDVTDVFNFIGTAARTFRVIIPAYSDGKGQAFTLPEGTTSTTIEYRVTGHGGESDTTGDCIGPADESLDSGRVSATVYAYGRLKSARVMQLHLFGQKGGERHAHHSQNHRHHGAGAARL